MRPLILLVAGLLVAATCRQASAELVEFDARLQQPSATDRSEDAKRSITSGDADDQLSWRWPRFRLWQYIVTLTLAPMTYGVVRFFPQPGRHWTDSNPIDDGVRDGLRAVSPAGRDLANLFSDIMWYSMMAYPIVIDAGLVAWGIRRSPRVAWQMFFITGQTFAITGTIGNILAYVGRARPFTRNCNEPDSRCDGGGVNRSFYSGHTAVAVSSACLLCFFHLELELYGGGPADAVACAGGVGVAAMVGTMRMVADKHYFTDVLFGAGVGVVTGLVIPWYLHFRYDSEPSGGERAFRTFGPLLTDSGAIGLSYIGAF